MTNIIHGNPEKDEYVITTAVDSVPIIVTSGEMTKLYMRRRSEPVEVVMNYHVEINGIVVGIHFKYSQCYRREEYEIKSNDFCEYDTPQITIDSIDLMNGNPTIMPAMIVAALAAAIELNDYVLCARMPALMSCNGRTHAR